MEKNPKENLKLFYKIPKHTEDQAQMTHTIIQGRTNNEQMVRIFWNSIKDNLPRETVQINVPPKNEGIINKITRQWNQNWKKKHGMFIVISEMEEVFKTTPSAWNK